MCACKYINCSDFKIESSSTIVSVTWKIEHALCCCVHECLKSPPFEFNKAMWYLTLDPSCNSDSNMYLDICLSRKGDSGADRIVDVIFKIGLRDSEGQLQYTYESRQQFGPYHSLGPDEGGIIRRVELDSKTEEFMPDDILTVFCELRTPNSASHDRERTNHATSTSGTYIEALAADLGALLKEQKNCDIALHIGDRVFQAHKSILGARSPVFAAIFVHNLQESETNVVTIEDVEPSDFGVLLDFIYSGSVQDLSIERAIGVYTAADNYDLKDLKSHCRGILLSGISTDWFFEIAVLADSHNDGKLMEGVKIFARKNGSCITSSDRCPNFFRNHSVIAAEIIRSAISSQFDAKA